MRASLRPFLCLILLVPLTVPLSPARADDALSGDTRRTVVTTLAKAIREGYVLEKRGGEIADRLLALLEQGAFDGAESLEELAGRLTGSLREISHDQHLRVNLRGRDPAHAVGREGGCRGGHGEKRGGPAPLAPSSLYSSRLLGGNVGLLEVGVLTSPLDELERSLRQLAGADALIIDLRRCPGGSMDAIQSLASIFFDSPTHLVTNRIRGMEPIEVLTSREAPGGVRFAGKPVFLLTSDFTGSGCEEFAFDIKYHDRAVVVGENTAGAGHGLVGDLTDLGFGLEAFIPNMRPEHPRFEGGFEGIGVPPDIPVPGSAALGEAHMLALAQLLDAEDEAGRRAGLERALLEAAVKHAGGARERTARERRLRLVAGAFEGGKRLIVHDGELLLQHDSGRALPLVEESKDTFAIAGTPGQKLRLARDRSGSVVAIEISAPGGESWKGAARVAGD